MQPLNVLVQTHLSVQAALDELQTHLTDPKLLNTEALTLIEEALRLLQELPQSNSVDLSQIQAAIDYVLQQNDKIEQALVNL